MVVLAAHWVITVMNASRRTGRRKHKPIERKKTVRMNKLLYIYSGSAIHACGPLLFITLGSLICGESSFCTTHNDQLFWTTMEYVWYIYGSIYKFAMGPPRKKLSARNENISVRFQGAGLARYVARLCRYVGSLGLHSVAWY